MEWQEAQAVMLARMAMREVELNAEVKRMVEAACHAAGVRW